MNQILAEMLRTKRTLSGDGKHTIEIHSNVSIEEGELLARLIAERKPKVSLEVGLAFGISSLFMCEALQRSVPNPRHIVIDPAQHSADYWQGAGLANLERAGFRQFVQFIEQPSQLAMPELIASGTKIDFAFVDGAHTFDHALLDFFLIDQLLNVGGVVVFDDTGWPSVRKVARFVASNRSYKIVDHVGSDEGPKCRGLHTRWPEELQADRQLGLEGECIAFEKLGDDSRHWDHFVDF